MAAFALTDATRVADVAALRTRFGARAPVLVETTLLRRRALVKLPDAGGWLLTDEAVQQATAAPVAEHRAGRIARAAPGAAVHDVTCSVGAELAALRKTTDRVLGSDLDPVRLAMARHNVGAGVGLVQADALRPVSRNTVVLADPGRRRAGRRRFHPADYEPALEQLLDAYQGRQIIVKCAPGIDFATVRHMGFDGEIEITSWRGSVREACLWSPGLSAPGVSRRASILDRDEEITDAEAADCAVAPAGRWIIDPDGAVVRAGLVRHYGARHGLWQLDPDIAYLSGDRLPPGVRGFEVLEQLPYREKRLAQVLSGLACGALEILVRGVDIDPDALRRRLRLRGHRSLSVVITRIGSGPAGRIVAFVCCPSVSAGR